MHVFVEAFEKNVYLKLGKLYPRPRQAVKAPTMKLEPQKIIVGFKNVYNQ